MAGNPFPGILDLMQGMPWPDSGPAPALDAATSYFGGFPSAQALTSGQYLAIPLSNPPGSAPLGGGAAPAPAPDVNTWQGGPPDTVIKGPTADELADRINQRLAGTPMQGLGNSLVANGQNRNLDPRFMAAIASPESSFGQHIKPGSFNPFGLLNVDGSAMTFPNWDAAIDMLGKTLNNDKNSPNLPKGAGPTYTGKYCQSGNCDPGKAVLIQRMQEMGGDPNAVYYPVPHAP